MTPAVMLKGEPAAVIGAVVAVANALLVAAVPLPSWLTTVLVVIVTAAGALGIRSQVTPTAMRAGAGAPPADDDEPSAEPRLLPGDSAEIGHGVQGDPPAVPL